MPKILPAKPAPRQVAPRVVTLRNELRSAIGGNVQRVGRKGSHYAASFQMPPMAYADALEWIDLRTEADTVVMTLPQPGLVIGNPGASLVKGGGQLGDSLSIDGLTPGYAIRKGQYLSILINGRHWLYATRAAVTASGTGEAIVRLEIPLRYPPTDNAPVNLAEPKIEGFASFDDALWSVDVARLIGLEFTIEERG